MYKQNLLREGLGITRRNHIQVLTQSALYFGAYGVLQALARLLERGDVEQVHRVIERYGRQTAATRKRVPSTSQRRH